MKKGIVTLILVIFWVKASFGEDFSSTYKCTITGNRLVNTVGIIFDYPMENPESSWCLSQMFGYAFNHNYPAGIDVAFFVEKKIKSDRITNKNFFSRIGISGGVISLTNSKDYSGLLYLDGLYEFKYILSQTTYAPVFIGFMLKGGASYLVENDISTLCPCFSAGISVGLSL